MSAISPNSTIIVQSPVSSSMARVCPKCGFPNRPDAKFCKRDGQPLVAGVALPPQQRNQPRTPIQARPAQQPPAPRGGPILARPSQQSIPRRSNAITARPVTSNGAVQTNDPGTAYRNGLQQFARKNYVQAISYFQRAQALGGPPYDIYYNLGRAYRQYGQSVKETDKPLFKENLKRAAENFEEAARQKPDALDTYFQLGMSYRDLEVYTQASNIFKKALTLAPRDSAIYYQLGLISMELGNYRDAERYFQEGLKIQPDHALILIALGQLQMKSNKPARAISTLQQATKVEPTSADAWYELGRAHMLAREWNLAHGALKNAYQINSLAPEITNAIATCLLRMNRKAEAKRMIDESLQHDPSNAEARRIQKQL